ncbi:MAG: hypothetical protein WCO53_02565 [Deltaproteobacteria bacterium]
MKRTILTLILIAAFGLAPLIPLAMAQDQPAAAAAPAQPQAADINRITQAAEKSGIKACSGRINQVSNFLTGGTPGVGAMIFLPPANPDQQLVSVSMEIPIKGAAAAYASASFAPNQANGCGGMYETVVYRPQKCDVVASKNFGTLKKIGALSKTIFVLDGGLTTKIFFMPAGTGCISIKKEVIQ